MVAFFFDLTTFEISQQKKNIGVGIFQLEKVGKNEIELKKISLASRN